MAGTDTAALVIIGSEVLSAKLQDENGPWAMGRLHALGVRLESVQVVHDRVDDVVAAVDRVRRGVGWVLTSGGVGPTHDDVTVKAVGAVFGRPIVRYEPLAEAIRVMHRRFHGGEEAPAPALRMADVPVGTRLLGDPGYPTLAVENVVMLPGVPKFFRYQFDQIAGLLVSTPWRLVNLFLSAGEEVVAPALDAVALAHPHVEIGSYPRFDETDHRVKVTVEGKDEAAVRAALAALLGALPEGVVLRTEGP